MFRSEKLSKAHCIHQRKDNVETLSCNYKLVSRNYESKSRNNTTVWDQRNIKRPYLILPQVLRNKLYLQH